MVLLPYGSLIALNLDITILYTVFPHFPLIWTKTSLLKISRFSKKVIIYKKTNNR